MHNMRIQYPLDGDKHITWDLEDPESVSKAQKAFDEAVGRGHRAYRVEQKNVPGDEVTTFDPAYTELLLVAAVAGG